MDFQKALCVWPEIGEEYTIVSESNEGGYSCYFVKDDEVMGRTHAGGGGFSWDYPQELMDIENKYGIDLGWRETVKLLNK